MNRNRHVLVLPVLAALLLAACSASSSPAPTPAAPPPLGAACASDAPSCNVIWSYSGNSVHADLTGATISGGGQRGEPNQVTGDFGTIGGGEGNIAGEGSTVAGGTQNTAVNFRAVVGGGSQNVAQAEEATVGGGLKNLASERYSTIAGGNLNVASDMDTTVAGGSGNVAGFTFATVGGGTQNTANSTAAVVAGGEHNLAQGTFSSVLGGLNNNADGYLATIGGGAGNQASGSYATIAGGFANSAAGAFSFAAGRKAAVSPDHAGTFLFADSNPLAFASLAANEFAVRATGGVRLVTGIDASGAPTSGVRLTAGSGAWETLSDVNAKAGFAPVDGQQILDSLMRIPIDTWYYRTQAPSIQHIGPTAQDFSAAFRVGEDPHYISTVDADGVALASIQQLYRLWQASQPSGLQQRVDGLQRQLLFSNGLAVLSLLAALASFWRRSAIGSSSPRAFPLGRRKSRSGPRRA